MFICSPEVGVPMWDMFPPVADWFGVIDGFCIVIVNVVGPAPPALAATLGDPAFMDPPETDAAAAAAAAAAAFAAFILSSICRFWICFCGVDSVCS